MDCSGKPDRINPRISHDIRSRLIRALALGPTFLLDDLRCLLQERKSLVISRRLGKFISHAGIDPATSTSPTVLNPDQLPYLRNTLTVLDLSPQVSTGAILEKARHSSPFLNFCHVVAMVYRPDKSQGESKADKLATSSLYQAHSRLMSSIIAFQNHPVSCPTTFTKSRS